MVALLRLALERPEIKTNTSRPGIVFAIKPFDMFSVCPVQTLNRCPRALVPKPALLGR